MAIRWVSTPESIKANQPSALAIVETLLAMGIAIWIAVMWKTYIHIAIGAMIAPLLLMRTDDSCIRAVLYARWLVENVHECLYPEKRRYSSLRSLKFVFYVIGFIAIFPVARIAAWIVTLLTSPVTSIKAIPHNWRHAAMLVDSWQWPHVLHPPNVVPDDWEGPRFGTIRDYFRGVVMVQDRVGQFIVISSLILLSTPAYAYRWSITSTALIWFPLLWAMRSTKEAAGPLQPCLDIYRRDPVTKIVLGVSIAAVAGFIIKLVLHYEWAGFVEWLNDGPLRQFLSLYVAPAEIPRWQLAIAINSAIAIVMYILAGHWLVRLEHERLTDETWPRKVFQTGLFIRRS